MGKMSKAFKERNPHIVARSDASRAKPVNVARREEREMSYRSSLLLVQSLSRIGNLRALMLPGTTISDLDGRVLNARFSRIRKSTRETASEGAGRAQSQSLAMGRAQRDVERQQAKIWRDNAKNTDLSTYWREGLSGDFSASASAAFLLRSFVAPEQYQTYFLPLLFDKRDMTEKPIPHVLPIEPTRILRDIQGKTEVVIPNP